MARRSGVRLPQRGWCWTSAPAPARTRSARLCAACSASSAAAGAIGAAVQAAAEWAVADGLVAAERRVCLNDLLDLPQPVELRALYDAMDSATRTRGTRETTAELVARASAERPLLLVYRGCSLGRPADAGPSGDADPQADRPAPGGAGDDLAHRGRPTRRCLALTQSPQPVRDHAIDLGPLRPQEAKILAGAYFMAHAELARRCVERAAGNPLFLEELLRHAEESAEFGRAGLGAELGAGAYGPARPARQAGAAGGVGARPALR